MAMELVVNPFLSLDHNQEQQKGYIYEAVSSFSLLIPLPLRWRLLYLPIADISRAPESFLNGLTGV